MTTYDRIGWVLVSMALIVALWWAYTEWKAIREHDEESSERGTHRALMREIRKYGDDDD